jgi:hypothetical protein
VLAAALGACPLQEAIAAAAREPEVDPHGLALRLFPDLAELVERGLLIAGNP